MKTLYTAALLGTLFMGGCDTILNQGGAVSKEPTAGEMSIVGSDNAFGFELMRKLNPGTHTDNVVISPMSVSMALGMTLNGAAGETETAMRSTLGYGNLTAPEINAAYRDQIDRMTNLDPGVKVQIANSIWNRPDLIVHQEFRDVNQTYFDAESREIDFNDPSAGPTINGWVKTKTNGKIESIVPKVIPNAVVMYLINAIYFKGTWTTQFDSKNTRDGQFTRGNGTNLTAKMMNRSGDMQYQKNEQFSAVDLPYGKGGFTMTVILPSASTSVDELLNGMTSQQWSEICGGFAKQKVILSLPKFKVEYGKSLNDALKGMGMAIAFSSSADLSGISGGPGSLYISSVEHKTFVEVNEEGTEAAGATSVGISRTSVEPSPSMIVNRPFIFAIRENRTGTILFLGKIVDPLK